MELKEKDKRCVTLKVEHIRDGKVIDTRYDEYDLITNVGKALAAGLLGAVSAPAAVTYLAIGIGTNAPAVTDTILQSEITTGNGARAASTTSLITTAVTNDTMQITHQWTFTAPFAVTEAGSFNASSSGVLYTHDVFTAVNVVSGDQLTVTIQIQMS
jgi:hypothetical protein